MWFFLVDHQKNPNKLHSHCSPNESTNQALALRKILVVHRIPIGPSPGPVRTTGMGNGGLWPRKMVTCHVWSIGIRSRGSHTLHTSHNHWKGKSMEKWWIWIYDMILFYHILSNHCVSFKENHHFHENKGCKSMDHDHDPTKKKAMVTWFETNSDHFLGVSPVAPCLTLWRKPNPWGTRIFCICLRCPVDL